MQFCRPADELRASSLETPDTRATCGLRARTSTPAMYYSPCSPRVQYIDSPLRAPLPSVTSSHRSVCGSSLDPRTRPFPPVARDSGFWILQEDVGGAGPCGPTAALMQAAPRLGAGMSAPRLWVGWVGAWTCSIDSVRLEPEKREDDRRVRVPRRRAAPGVDVNGMHECIV